MTPPLLIHECRRRGIALWAEGGRLKYRADSGEMTPELLATLRDAKSEILAELGGGSPQLGGGSPQGSPHGNPEWTTRVDYPAPAQPVSRQGDRPEADAEEFGGSPHSPHEAGIRDGGIHIRAVARSGSRNADHERSIDHPTCNPRVLFGEARTMWTTSHDWPEIVARLRSQADADGVLRDDLGDLFNRLADRGRA